MNNKVSRPSGLGGCSDSVAAGPREVEVELQRGATL